MTNEVVNIHLATLREIYDGDQPLTPFEVARALYSEASTGRDPTNIQVHRTTAALDRAARFRLAVVWFNNKGERAYAPLKTDGWAPS